MGNRTSKRVPKTPFKKPIKNNLKQTTPTWDSTIEFVPQLQEDIPYYVIKVYDGDTITLAVKFDWDPNWYRMHVRLLGLDTPEMRSQDSEEKSKASQAKDTLSAMILGKYVTLSDISVEKYGRILANVWYEGKNMSEYMIDMGLGVYYDGGKKS